MRMNMLKLHSLPILGSCLCEVPCAPNNPILIPILNTHNLSNLNNGICFVNQSQATLHCKDFQPEQELCSLASELTFIFPLSGQFFTVFVRDLT